MGHNQPVYQSFQAGNKHAVVVHHRQQNAWAVHMTDRDNTVLSSLPAEDQEQMLGPLDAQHLLVIQSFLQKNDAKALFPDIQQWIKEEEIVASQTWRKRMGESMTQDRIESLFLWIVGAALLTSAIAQAGFQSLLVSAGYWAHSPGYQFEISNWNLVLLLPVVIPAAIFRNYGLRLCTFGAILIMCIGFGANHGLSLLHEPTPKWHLFIALAEISAAPVFLALMFWRARTVWKSS